MDTFAEECQRPSSQVPSKLSVPLANQIDIRHLLLNIQAKSCAVADSATEIESLTGDGLVR